MSEYSDGERAFLHATMTAQHLISMDEHEAARVVLHAALDAT